MNNLNNIVDYLKVFNNINKRSAYKPRTMAQEPRNMYNQGQLVRNTVDGSRPGYKGDDTVVDTTVRRYNYDKSIKQKLETIYKNIQEYKNIKTFRTADKEAEIIKRLDNFALDFKEATGRLPVANEIRSFGVASQSIVQKSGGGKGDLLKKGVHFMEPTKEMLTTKWRTRDIPEIQTNIIEASKSEKYMKPDGSPNIKRMAKDFYPDKKLDDARKQIRITLERETDYVPKANVPGEITSAKQAKKNAMENIKIAQTKAGIPTTKQAEQVMNTILSQNEIYQKMSVEDIAKDKDLLKRLRIQIDSVTGDVDYNGYTKLDVNKKTIMNDLELAQHAKDRSIRYELFTPDHITPKSLRKQNVGYPINFQSTTYMENSHLDNARTYLMKNPDGNYQAIDNYLSSKNLTIRGPDFKRKYGFKLPITFDSKTGTSNIVEASGISGKNRINILNAFCGSKRKKFATAGAVDGLVCSMDEIQTNIKKQTNQAMKFAKDGKIPKQFGKLRSLGMLFGWVDAPIEFMFAAPHLIAGDIEGAKRATTAGIFGWGKVDLDNISDEDAKRYLKHTKDMNDYMDNYGIAIDAEANLDNLNKLPEGVQTEKKFMFDKQFEDAKKNMDDIQATYQDYGYTYQEGDTPIQGKVATQKYIRDKVKSDFENKIENIASNETFKDADPELLKEQLRDLGGRPEKETPITDLETYMKNKGEEMAGNTNLFFNVKPYVLEEAEALGVPEIFDDYALGAGVEGPGRKSLQDAYSEIPLEYASGLAALEKKQLEEGLKKKRLEKFLQSPYLSQGGIASLNVKK